MKAKTLSFFRRILLISSIVLLVGCATSQLGNNVVKTPTTSTATAASQTSLQGQQQSAPVINNAATTDPSKAVCPQNKTIVFACYDEKTGWNDWQKNGNWFITKDNYLGNTGKGGTNSSTALLLSKPLSQSDNYTVVLSVRYDSGNDFSSLGGIVYYNADRGYGYSAAYGTGRPGVAIQKYGTNDRPLVSAQTRFTSIHGWHTLTIRSVNRVISFWIDGVVQVAYPIDDDNGTGRVIGIMSTGTEFAVKRVLVVNSNEPLSFG